MQQGRPVLVTGAGVSISGASSAIAVGGPIQAVSLDDTRRLVEVDGVGQVAGVAAQDAP